MVLRPSAKSIVFFSVISLLSIGTLLFLLYANTNLSLSPPEHKIKIQLERGSFIKKDLVNYFVKSVASENSYEEFKIIFDEVVKKGNSSYYVARDSSLELTVYNNYCDIASDCVRIYIPLSDISGAVWRGLIGIEDSRFLTHQGIDWRSILRAMFVNIKAGRIVQGGSTLTQQLVKNTFLSSERTYTRKLKEALYSFILELRYPKLNIIESYLNNVYWGSYRGLKIYGIKAASLFYFNKHPNELDEFEASILIGMLKGPSLYSPFNRNKNNIKKRSELVFKKLIQDKFFLGKNIPWSRNRWERWFSTDFGNRHELIKSIVKTKKPDLQKFVLTYFLEKKIMDLSKRYPNADLAYRVVGLINHKEKVDIFSKPSIVDLPKNIGSLLKPIIYSRLFLKYNELEEFSTEELTLNLKSGKWSPKDHYNETEKVTLRFALQKSLNIPFIRAASSYGFDSLERYLEKIIPSLKKPLGEYPSQLLGSVELTEDQILHLYLGFLSQQCNNEAIKKVVKILSKPNESTTESWVGVLENAEFFGKTGTSNNGYDNWYLYYDSRDLLVVWIGHAGERNIGRLALSGGGVSFAVLKDFLTSRAKNIGQNICDE